MFHYDIQHRKNRINNNRNRKNNNYIHPKKHVNSKDEQKKICYGIL